MIIENENNNDSDDDENNDNGDDNKLPADSPHKRQMMLSFDVTFVESENNSRVSGDTRHHVPHLTSLWCDIFTPHPHICIVESSYESNSSYVSLCIPNCVRGNWLWCFGNTAIRSVDFPHKRPLILHLDVSLLLAWANLWNNSRVAGVISYIFWL